MRSGAGVRLRPRLEELREEEGGAGAATGGSGGGGIASVDRLSLGGGGSHTNESFNSEEGFGSPVKQRRECVRGSGRVLGGQRRCGQWVHGAGEGVWVALVESLACLM